MTRAQTQQTLRQLPVKWALALLALIVVYAFAQPALNSRFGWSLPSLARLMGEPEPKAKASDQNKKAKQTKSHKATSLDSDSSGSTSLVEQPRDQVAEDSNRDTAARSKIDPPGENGNLAATQEPATPPKISTKSDASPKKPQSQADRPGGTSTQTTAQTDTQTKSQPKSSTTTQSKTSPPPSDPSLRYGILKEVGRERYVSVEGLQYNPGSEEGHRLRHLERHLEDMPDRPGKHGVFNGHMEDALKWIDDAYARGKRGAKGVNKTEEDNRTVYEVPFSQPIGYIGGRDGKRAGNPPAKRLRLVVEGNKFITAFPF